MSVSGALVVSIHPYFKVHEGKLEAFKALLPEFVARTSTEEKCLSYDFSICDGSVVHCRETYLGGEAALKHLENVGDLLEQALQVSDLERLELHGPAGELEKLRGPLAELDPQWFVWETGVGAAD